MQKKQLFSAEFKIFFFMQTQTKNKKQSNSDITKITPADEEKRRKQKMNNSSRLLRKSALNNARFSTKTPWFFAAVCFLWASFLTVTMLSSNEQSLEFNRERMNREIEARVTRELVKREKKLKKKKLLVPSADEEADEEEEEEEEEEENDNKNNRMRVRKGPLAGAYRSRNRQAALAAAEKSDKNNEKREFKGPFGRVERLIFEKGQAKKKLELEHLEKERTRRALDAHLEDTDEDEEKTPGDTLDVEEKIQEALGGALEREKSHDEEEDEDEKRRRLIETDGSDSATESAEPSTTFPQSVYGQAHLLKDLPGFPEMPPLVLSAVKPKAYLFRNFLSAEECDHLMKLAKAELAPSTVVGAGGTSVPSTIRTSAGMFLRKAADKTLENIEYRIAAASGTPEPNGEGMQILRYDVGQKYDPKPLDM